MDTIKIAQEVFDVEIEQLKALEKRIDRNFTDVVEAIMNTTGRVVVTGIGKTGIIGKKIAASLASTGTVSFFMHAAEGLHGDLGMVFKEDIVIAISNSGSSQEVLNLMPSLKKIGCTIVAMTGNLKSPLAREADYVLDIEVEKEACPMGLAPTASTTAALVMGDALVVALIKLKGFREENFAVYHPGGALGRRLLTNVESIMHKELPVVYTETNLKDIIYEISSKRVGMTMVYNYENEVVGLITDGDIRRHIFEGYDDIKNIQARDIMIKDFKFIGAEEMASKAWGIMNEANISSLPVIENGQLKGIITMHDVFDFKN